MNKGFFTGRVAREPIKRGSEDSPVCFFTLIRNEYAGQNRAERKVALSFTAFGGKAEALAKNLLEGDQLNVEYRVANNDREGDAGVEYGFSFVVEEFEFGAPGPKKREKLAQAHG